MNSVSPRSSAYRAYWVIVSIAGLLLAARATYGPFSWIVSVGSPMNVEAVLAILFILALAANSSRNPESGRGPIPTSLWIRLGPFLLILLTVAAFWQSMKFFLLSDDFVLIKQAGISSWAELRSLFNADPGYGFYRPVARLSLAMNAAWAGTDPAAWHKSNLALHIINSLLVYLLSRKLSLSREAACFAAALFSLHGTRPEAVVWVAGRFDLLATFFTLSAWILFARSLEGSGASLWIQRSLSFAFMVLAVLSKESAYVFPLLAMLWLYGVRCPLERWPRILWPYFLLTAALFAHRLVLFGGIGGYRDAQSGQAKFLLPDFLTMLKALVPRLGATLCFPVNWSTRPGRLLGVLMLLCVFSYAWLALCRLQRRRLVFSLGILLISVLPPLHMLLMGPDLEKSRLLYLGSIGFCLVLASVADTFQRRVFWLSPGIILALNLAALSHNLKAWGYASEKARLAIKTVVDCADAGSGNVVVEEVPPILRGVYFLGNGLREGVAMQRGDIAARMEIRQAGEPTVAREGDCLLRWDGSRDEFRRVNLPTSP